MQEDSESNPRCPKISFSREEIQGFYKPWSKALVVKVLERSFSYPVIKRRLESLWARTGHIQVTDMSNAFYLVRFSDAEDYQKAAFGGPWKIFDYYITVARWSPEFNEEAPIQKILTWVRLPKLPIHYFNLIAVERIGNHIGRTVRLDLATSEGARARYARLCVEVDLTKPLLGKYMVDGRVFLIEYESLDNICFSCGMYGHKLGECPLNAPSVQVPSPESVAEPSAMPTADEDSGSWMVVARRSRKSRPAPASSSKPAAKNGSRFSALAPEAAEGASAIKETPQRTTPQVATAKESPYSEHAAQLSRVLQAAFDSGKPKEQVQEKTLPASREALKEVTPVAPSNVQQTVSFLPADSQLVAVPISLAKSSFVASASQQKTRGKGKQKENSPPSQAKQTKGKNVKRFVSKKVDSPPTEMTGTKDPNWTCLGSPNGGRPPDKSN
ncbi:hypothetical protein LINPERHAP2_LOCUS34079 [Linum perenne]